MSATILDGTAVANQIRREAGPVIEAFTAQAGRRPGLGIVLVGNNPASEIYVGAKLKSAGEAGLRADLERLRRRRSTSYWRLSNGSMPATCTTAFSCNRHCPIRWGRTRSAGCST
jgi:hypothetical protein